MNVELIVDSTVDVPERVRSRLTVVPLTIHFGQEEFLDGVTMDRHRFYERLVESDVLPTTSQASPAAFDQELRRVRDSGSAAVVYLAVYPILNALFGTDLLVLGIYLPLLVVEPLLTYRFGRVQETLHKAVSKGLRITVGYALLLMLLGCVREWLALGTVFGTPVGQRAVLPMAGMPAGGFIVLGVVCAIWRALARKRQKYLKNEARGYLAVHPQENRKEAEQ